MSTKNPIGKEAAQKMLSEWQDATGAEIDAEQKESLLRAIQQGRLDADIESEIFTYRLRKPIELDNGETVEAITIEEPNMGQIVQAAKGNADDMTQTLRLLSYVSGQPVGVLNRIKMRDLSAAGAVLSFFG